MGVIERYTPTHYAPIRISLEPDGEGGIVALADFRIYNAEGRAIGDDHPAATLTPGEMSAFLSWFNSKATTYEAATGLGRYVPPGEGE